MNDLQQQLDTTNATIDELDKIKTSVGQAALDNQGEPEIHNRLLNMLRLKKQTIRRLIDLRQLTIDDEQRKQNAKLEAEQFKTEFPEKFAILKAIDSKSDSKTRRQLEKNSKLIELFASLPAKQLSMLVDDDDNNEQ